MNTKIKKKIKRMRAYADIGSHNGVFMFDSGPVADRYPKLLHVYKEKVTPDLRPVIIEFRLK
jgi:hypothetical protein